MQVWFGLEIWVVKRPNFKWRYLLYLACIYITSRIRKVFHDGPRFFIESFPYLFSRHSECREINSLDSPLKYLVLTVTQRILFILLILILLKTDKTNQLIPRNQCPNRISVVIGILGSAAHKAVSSTYHQYLKAV